MNAPKMNAWIDVMEILVLLNLDQEEAEQEAPLKGAKSSRKARRLPRKSGS
jgi:hypothetical protein